MKSNGNRIEPRTTSERSLVVTDDESLSVVWQQTVVVENLVVLVALL